MNGNARALKGVRAGALLAAGPAIPDGVHFVRLVGSRGKRYNVPLAGTSWLVDRPTAAQADADLANGYGVGVVPFTMGGFAVLDVDKGNAEALIRDHPPAALYETRPARDGAPPRYHLWYRHDVPLSKSNWYSTQYRCGGQLISATTFVLLRSIPEWLAQLALGLGGPLPAHILDNPTPRPARAKKRALRRPREDAKPLDEKRPSTAVDLEDLRIRQDRSIYWRIPRARPGWRHDSMVRAIRRVLGQPGNWSLSLDDAVKVCAVLWRRHRRRLPWSEALAITVWAHEAQQDANLHVEQEEEHLRRCRNGGIRSGEVRRELREDKALDARRLKVIGFDVGQIAKAVNCSRRSVFRYLADECHELTDSPPLPSPVLAKGLPSGQEMTGDGASAKTSFPPRIRRTQPPSCSPTDRECLYSDLEGKAGDAVGKDGSWRVSPGGVSMENPRPPPRPIIPPRRKIDPTNGGEHMPPGSTLRDLGIPQAKREADMITDTDAYRLGVDAGVKRAHEAMRNLHGHFLQLVGRQTPCQCDPCISVAAVMLALRQLRGPLEGR